MPRPIHRFGFAGHLKDDSDFIRLKARYEFLIIDDMRDAGYIPVLDLDTFWSTMYDREVKQYAFTITVYGVYVGRKRSLLIEGMSGQGKLHPRSITSVKSKPSSASVIST